MHFISLKPGPPGREVSVPTTQVTATGHPATRVLKCIIVKMNSNPYSKRRTIYMYHIFCVNLFP